MIKKSVQEVSKHESLDTPAVKASLAKTDSRYWKARLFRNSYKRDGMRFETADWCIKIAYGGRRETFNLRTPERDAAATRAVRLYKTITSEGWDAAMDAYKPKPAPKAATVGEFINAALAISKAREASKWEYAKCIRRLAADMKGMDRSDPSKTDYRTGGAERWRAKVDVLPLAIITPERFEAWRDELVQGAGKNPLAQRRAKNTANSVFRKAKALFASDVVKRLPAALVLPSPLPFEGVKAFERQSMRYVSKIDAAQLIQAAQEELGSDPKQLEVWKAFVLLMFAGLRKGEADKLRWDSVDFTAGVIRIETHEFFEAKSEDSIGTVELDPEVVAMLRGWRAKDRRGEYVLCSPVEPRLHVRGYYHYRALRTFNALRDWLRGHGITAEKALHELRKEAGSLVNARYGIHAASSFLRHADIAITAAHYLDNKQRITVGFGSLTVKPEPTANVIDFQPESLEQPKKRRARA